MNIFIKDYENLLPITEVAENFKKVIWLKEEGTLKKEHYVPNSIDLVKNENENGFQPPGKCPNHYRN